MVIWSMVTAGDPEDGSDKAEDRVQKVVAAVGKASIEWRGLPPSAMLLIGE